MSQRMPSYGGQAIIEGVMMRGKQTVAIACRTPDKQITILQEPLADIYRSRWVKIPFLRGLVMLWDSLGLGMRALTHSANVQTGEDEKLEGPALVFTMLFSFTIAIVLFFLLPAVIGQLIQHLLVGDLATVFSTPVKHFFAPPENVPASAAWWGNLGEGVFRLLLLIGYIASIGRVPEIARVFAYHGAEHKTINAFEAGAELTPDIVQRFSLQHPRCGTAFLLTLVLLSVIFFSLLGPLPLSVRLLSRLLMIPVLAGIAYEYIRWTANHLDSRLVRLLLRPNLALQKLTTREPSLDMIEVSIAAFQTMRAKEDELVV